MQLRSHHNIAHKMYFMISRQAQLTHIVQNFDAPHSSASLAVMLALLQKFKYLNSDIHVCKEFLKLVVGCDECVLFSCHICRL